MMTTNTQSNQRGFTLLELLIATMVFSVIFLGTTTAMMQIGKLYYKGLVTTRTQETARGITDQISQQLQLGTGELTTAAPSPMPVTNGGEGNGNEMYFGAYCIGNTRYTYRLNAQVDDSILTRTYDVANQRLAHALWRDTVANGASCTPANLSFNGTVSSTNPSPPAPIPPSSFGEEMLADNTRLTQFEINCDAPTKVCTIAIGVLYGDEDLITPDPATVNKPTGPDVNLAKQLHCATIIGNQWCAGSQFTTSVAQRVGDN